MSPNQSKRWFGYRVAVSCDPGSYDAETTEEEGRKIAEAVAKMVAAEFPGVEAAVAAGSDADMTRIIGPNGGPETDEGAEDIRRWIEAYWIAALSQ